MQNHKDSKFTGQDKMTDEAKYQILKEHQIDEAVCEALGINLDELKTLEDDNYPNDGMEYEAQIK